MSNIFLRPYLSDIVPQISMDAAKNTKKSTNVRLTSLTVELKCSAIVGKAGRYISVVIGGIALMKIK